MMTRDGTGQREDARRLCVAKKDLGRRRQRRNPKVFFLFFLSNQQPRSRRHLSIFSKGRRVSFPPFFICIALTHREREKEQPGERQLLACDAGNALCAKRRVVPPHLETHLFAEFLFLLLPPCPCAHDRMGAIESTASRPAGWNDAAKNFQVRVIFFFYYFSCAPRLMARFCRWVIAPSTAPRTDSSKFSLILAMPCVSLISLSALLLQGPRHHCAGWHRSERLARLRFPAGQQPRTA
jgi:hypothetical protein